MRGSKPAGSSGVSLVEIPCMQNREHTTPPMFAFRDQSRCVSCVVHSRQITSHGFVTRMSHIHMSRRTSHTIPYRIDQKTRANTTPLASGTHSFTKAHAKAVPYITALYNALSLQYSEHSGQTREKQKPKAKGEAWPWSSRRRSWQLQLAAQTGGI